MTRDVVRAAVGELLAFHARFAGCFGRREAREHARIYLKGLLLGEGRKSVEPIALTFATAHDGGAAGREEVVALQSFISNSPWNAAGVQCEIQALFAEELLPSTPDWSLGVVGVIDGSGFVKSGPESVGVQPQYCGRLGKTANCQVGEFLIGVTPAGCAALDHQLFLPREWAEDAERRAKTHVPSDVVYQSQTDIAAELVRRTLAHGHVKFDWLTADAQYGDNGDFLDAMETLSQRYLVEVRAATTVWTVDPAKQVPLYEGLGRPPSSPRRDDVCSVARIAKELPSEAWQPVKLREGAKGPLVFEFARVRVWAVRHRKPGPPVWLLLRRSLDMKNREIKYYVSNADEQEPLKTMAQVTGTRWRVEEYFEDAKGHLGMADYETRSWASWHHHMSLVAMAHLFVTLTKRQARQAIPDLTLDMAVRLLASGLSRPTLTPEMALQLTEYHLTQNRIAHTSHRKTWLRKHQKLDPKVWL
jgi:SRSO17 transposase